MNMIAGVVAATTIMSIMASSALAPVSLSMILEKERKQAKDMMSLKEAFLSSYEETGLLEPDVVDLNNYSSHDYTDFKDMSGGDFYILTNSDTPFTYQGGTYRSVIITGYSDGLGSSIDTNVLVVREDEDFLLISDSDLESTSRGKTQIKIASCDSASEVYNLDNAGYPSTAYDLVSGGYIESYKVVDEFGSILKIDGSGDCYSTGVNRTDELGAGDDFYS